MLEYVVTTTRDNQDELQETAARWARVLRHPVVVRGSLSMEKILREYSVPAALVATSGGPKVFTRSGVFFYHPSMAKLRIQHLQAGEVDHLMEAMALQPGMRVLDCTLGLGTDAAVASFVAGDQGKVIGLEGSELLHFVVQQGLKNYNGGGEAMVEALRRVVAVHTDAEIYLRTRNENYDVVYFDPMFETPVEASSNMRPLRRLAYDCKLTKEFVDLALQRAPRVVIKERYLKFLRVLGCTEFYGGKYSTVKFGVVQR